MKLGQTIRNVRTSKNLSLSQLAQQIPTTPFTLKSWESGRSSPPLHHVFAISAALHMPVYELLARANGSQNHVRGRYSRPNYESKLRQALAKMSWSERDEIMHFAKTLAKGASSAS